jgi:Na+/H+ antiporter NhaD/arsenite permease-like protein
MAALDLHRPAVLYASAIVAAQAVSNVPATVLLLDHAPDVMALATAVNVGGFGLVTGSLANLIALRLARQPHGLRVFHQVSIPFLLVCAPLVYLACRALGA